MRQPQLSFDQDMISVSATLNKNPLNIDQYCDNMHQELHDAHPYSIVRDEESFHKLEKHLDHFLSPENAAEFFYAAPLMGRRSWWHEQTWWPDRHMDLQLVSPFVHLLTTHGSYEDWCSQMHPSLDSYRCAIAYGYFKSHDDYDRILDFDRTFFGYFDDQVQKAPLYILRNISIWILYTGLLLYMLKIKLP